MPTKATIRNHIAKHGCTTMLGRPRAKKRAPIATPYSPQARAQALELKEPPTLSGGGGFVSDRRSVAGEPPGRVRKGSTVELLGGIETSGGANYSAGARFQVAAREGGAWRLERGGVVLRNVSGFQIRLVEVD